MPSNINYKDEKDEKLDKLIERKRLIKAGMNSLNSRRKKLTIMSIGGSIGAVSLLAITGFLLAIGVGVPILIPIIASLGCLGLAAASIGDLPMVHYNMEELLEEKKELEKLERELENSDEKIHEPEQILSVRKNKGFDKDRSSHSIINLDKQLINFKGRSNSMDLI